MSMETLMTVLLFWDIGFVISNEGVLVVIGSSKKQRNIPCKTSNASNITNLEHREIIHQVPWCCAHT